MKRTLFALSLIAGLACNTQASDNTLRESNDSLDKNLIDKKNQTESQLDVVKLLKVGKLKIAPLKCPYGHRININQEEIQKFSPITLKLPEGISYKAVDCRKIDDKGAYGLLNGLITILPEKKGIYIHDSYQRDIIGVCKPQECDLQSDLRNPQEVLNGLIIWEKGLNFLRWQNYPEGNCSGPLSYKMKEGSEKKYEKIFKNDLGKKSFKDQFTHLGFKFSENENISLSEDGKHILVINESNTLAQRFIKVPRSEAFFLTQHTVVNHMKDEGDIEVCYFASKENLLLKISSYETSWSGLNVRYKFNFVGDLKDRNISIDKPLVIKDEGGFLIGGKNETDFIKQLKEINKLSIEQLESNMRPREYSTAGFLGKSESLLEVMAQDNQFVVDENNLSHGDMAYPLKLLVEAEYNNLLSSDDPFLFGGKVFLLQVIGYKGIQHSPFKDGKGTNRDYNVWNLTDGSAISFSGLVPELIEQYGFYEGTDTTFRVSPQQILKVFGHIIKKD